MKVLLLNQAFYPDVASTGQHLADLAVALAESGHEVTVLTSSRAYDRPSVRFARRERWRGIDIRRLACTGFGKGARWRRAADFAAFLLSCSLRLLLLPRQDVVVALTTPPLISSLAALFVRIKGGRLLFWVMDLNPDEAVAAGWLRQGSLMERFLASILRYGLRSAHRLVVLDRFMQQRIREKGIAADRITVLAPWSHDDAVASDAAGRKAFREKHGLADKYVVMYSGNHSPCHPLDTVLGAARQLAGDGRVVFCFVGGGSEFDKVGRFAAEHGLRNIVQLPYQPLAELGASLSAADLHVVVMGNEFAGIVHPCKLYNILAVGIPILYVGPEDSHIGDVLARPFGQSASRSVRHGDTGGAVRAILAGVAGQLEVRSPREIAVAQEFSKKALLPQMTSVVEALCQQSKSGVGAGVAAGER